MKVYELIEKLMQCKAGADVYIANDTFDVVYEDNHINSVDDQDDYVNLFTPLKEEGAE